MSRQLVSSPFLHTKGLWPDITPTSLIADGLFLSGITGWTPSNGSIAHDMGEKHFGANSLRLTASNSSAKVEYTTASVAAGLHKLVKIFVKSNTQAAGKFIRVKITANGDASTQDTVALKLSSTQWKELWCSYTIPSTGTLKIGIESVDLASGDIVYITHVSDATVELPAMTVSGRDILYNGVPVYLRGTNLTSVLLDGSHPTTWATEDKQLRYDLEELAVSGYNMFRIYDDESDYNRNTFGRGFDCAMQLGFVIMVLDFATPNSTDISIATGQTNRDAYIDAFELSVNRMKDHPAVVAFGWGNEPNFNFTGDEEADLQTLIEDVCAAGKVITSRHWMYTSYGGIPTGGWPDDTTPSLDIVGYTFYGGSAAVKSRGSNVNNRDVTIARRTTKPTLPTEIGCGAYDGSLNGAQEEQATTDLTLISQLEGFYTVNKGHTVFQSHDDRDAAGDTSWYGKQEAVASGSAQTRTPRIAHARLKNWQNTHSIPISL